MIDRISVLEARLAEMEIRATVQDAHIAQLHAALIALDGAVGRLADWMSASSDTLPGEIPPQKPRSARTN
jgi:uncharacterized coiled-coil protein SlyX